MYTDVVHKRRHGAIKPAAQREAFEHNKSIIKAQHAVKRRKEIGSQIKVRQRDRLLKNRARVFFHRHITILVPLCFIQANGYKSILTWRKDPTVDVKRPMAEKRLVRKIPDRAASIARMELQNKAKLRSSLTRFYFPFSPKKSRQDTLKKAGLLAARKSCVIGDGGGNRRMRSFGVADAFTHSVYGGKALNSEVRKSGKSTTWFNKGNSTCIECLVCWSYPSNSLTLSVGQSVILSVCVCTFFFPSGTSSPSPSNLYLRLTGTATAQASRPANHRSRCRNLIGSVEPPLFRVSSGLPPSTHDCSQPTCVVVVSYCTVH